MRQPNRQHLLPKLATYALCLLALLLAPNVVTAQDDESTFSIGEYLPPLEDILDFPEGYNMQTCTDLADNIFEGIVTACTVHKVPNPEPMLEYFWNSNNHTIDSAYTLMDSTYTIYYINVTKVFKGKVRKKVALMTPGGVIIDEQISLKGWPGSVFNPGVFIKQDFGFPIGDNALFFCTAEDRPYKAKRGYQKLRVIPLKDKHLYIYSNAKAIIPKEQEEMNQELHKKIYDPISERVGKPYKTYKPLFTKPKLPKGGAAHAKGAAQISPDISSFFPASCPAGLLNDSSLLTIVGSGFGNYALPLSVSCPTCAVQFERKEGSGPNFFDAPNDHIRSWQDDKIEVWVPSLGKPNITNQKDAFAKSGAVRVQIAMPKQPNMG